MFVSEQTYILVLRSLGHGQIGRKMVFVLGIACRHGMDLAVVIIPSLASHRLTDCFSFVASTSCSTVIFTCLNF